jgi:hypothetical protein
MTHVWGCFIKCKRSAITARICARVDCRRDALKMLDLCGRESCKQYAIQSWMFLGGFLGLNSAVSPSSLEVVGDCGDAIGRIGGTFVCDSWRCRKYSYGRCRTSECFCTEEILRDAQDRPAVRRFGLMGLQCAHATGEKNSHRDRRRKRDRQGHCSGVCP